MRLLLRSLILLALPALDAAAVQVRVVAAGGLRLAETIRATVRRVDGDSASAKSVLLSPTSSTLLDLEPGTWEISADVPDTWADPAYSTAGQDVTLTLWPRATISGLLPDKLTSSEQLLVHFAPAGESGPSGRALCTTTARSWSCAIPSGAYDLRFTRSGYATEFRWDVKLAAGTATKLGTLQFTPGSSVIGRVHVESRNARELLRKVEISLAPRGSNAHWGEKTRTYTSRPDERGFFQVRGLAPGEYDLHARSKDLVANAVRVQIVAGTNAELKEPLVLGPPLRVSVQLDPPLDPEQKPWRVRLLRKFGDALDAVAMSSATQNGAWSAERLPPDDYLLVVSQQNGAEWKNEQITLRIGDAALPVHVRLDAANIRGRVRLGERPIAAKVHFPDENGVPLIAGEDGRFEGPAPPQKDDHFRVLVTSETPAVKRSLVVPGDRSSSGELTLDIELPRAVIAGRTIKEDRSPEPHAIVTIQSEDDKTFEQMFSASDGVFQFEGFDPGVYFLYAEGDRTRSVQTRVEVDREGIQTTDLVLRREAMIRGRVTMRGMPVAGATVTAFARDVRPSDVHDVKSDAAGWFTLHVPAEATALDFIAFPRGFSVTGARLPNDPKKLLVVEVGQDGGSLTASVPKDYAAMLQYDGAEFSLAWVARQAGGIIEDVDAHYRITIPHLESGKYAICHGAKCVPVFVPPLGQAAVSLVD